LRNLHEIQPDFEEEAKAYARLWSQGKKKELGNKWIIQLLDMRNKLNTEAVPKLFKPLFSLIFRQAV